MTIHVHIERIVLDGLPIDAAQTRRFRSALESELARLLRGSGLSAEWNGGGAVPAVETQTVHVDRHIHPKALGAGVAAVLHGRLGSDDGSRSRSTVRGDR
jgi:hypothetical protein